MHLQKLEVHPHPARSWPFQTGNKFENAICKERERKVPETTWAQVANRVIVLQTWLRSFLFGKKDRHVKYVSFAHVLAKQCPQPLTEICKQCAENEMRKRGIRGESWKGRGERKSERGSEEGPNGQKVVWTVTHSDSWHGHSKYVMVNLFTSVKYCVHELPKCYILTD